MGRESRVVGGYREQMERKREVTNPFNPFPESADSYSSASRVPSTTVADHTPRRRDPSWQVSVPAIWVGLMSRPTKRASQGSPPSV